MVIHVTIDTAEPLTGSASCCEREPVPFVGWLQLLRAVAELVGTPGCTAEQDTSGVSSDDIVAGERSPGDICAMQASHEQATLRIVGPHAANLAAANLAALKPQVTGPQQAQAQIHVQVGEGHPA